MLDPQKCSLYRVTCLCLGPSMSQDQLLVRLSYDSLTFPSFSAFNFPVVFPNHPLLLYSFSVPTSSFLFSFEARLLFVDLTL